MERFYLPTVDPARTGPGPLNISYYDQPPCPPPHYNLFNGRNLTIIGWIKAYQGSKFDTMIQKKGNWGYGDVCWRIGRNSVELNKGGETYVRKEGKTYAEPETINEAAVW